MPTLSTPAFDELSPQQRHVLEEIATRRGVAPNELSMMQRSRVHWPEYLQASQDEARHAFKAITSLDELTKEAISTTVAMVNNCEF